MMTSIRDGNHALLVGNLAGMAIKEMNLVGTVDFAYDDEGNYENYFFITRKSGKYRVTVEFEENKNIEI